MLKRFMNVQTESSNVSRSRKAEEIRKQMARHRRNLISICRLTIQSLKEKSMYNSIDDNSEEFLNFATILEHILSHRLKGEATWFRFEEPREFWDFIYVACRNVPNNCLQSLHMMEDFKSSRVKGRAWIRAVLMEKRLSEYVVESMQDERLLKIFYGEGSFMRSEESQILKECLQDLNLVDFSFCLKGSNNLQTGVARIVDYTPYLSCSERLTGTMQQRAMDVDISLLAVQEDEDQFGDQSLEQQLQNLKSKYTSVCDQKRYLEERLQASNDQLNDALMQVKVAQETVKKMEERSKGERLQLENVIIELQDQIGYLKDAHLASRKELEEHLTTGHWHLRRDHSGQAIAMDYVTMNTGSSSIDTGADGVSLQSLEPPTSPSQISPTSSNSLTLLLGKRVDERPMRETKEETPSLVPLAGSFTSQFSVKSNDNVFTSSTSSSANLQDGHASQTLPKLSESGSISSAVSLADSLLSTVSAPP
ncbi:RUN domain-containing protein 3B-like [Anneissia japonica]|uniref:RUN domain-containing protein 3B-like n=1 Tax=Anneissia japonica TaxID=1529436 RepID=UPI00142553C9|nr:RUN domain-containing protein 3B-like [Anneissia japonica]